LLAIAVAAPAAALALSSDAPDLNTPRYADDPSISTVWDQPATPAPVITVRPPEAQLPTPVPALGPNPLWEIPLSRLSTTRERPIFSPSRRPLAAVVAAAPPSAPPPAPKPARVERPQLSLVGTVSGRDESFGIFIDQMTKAALRLKIGEDYRGWKLRAVQGREVTLDHDQLTAILTMPQPGAGALSPASGQVEDPAEQYSGRN
jgi:general secretion pathway protein N